MELHQVVLCRALYAEAETYLARNDGVHVGLAVSIAQDAVELFLRAVMKVRPVAGQKIPEDFVKCMDYIDAAADQVETKYVPFRAKLIELNKARVNFKHYGLIPDKVDSRRLLGYVQDFFDIAAERFFGVRFSDLSVADLVTSTTVRDRLKDAECTLRDGDIERALGYSAEAVDVASRQLIAMLSPRSSRWPPSTSARFDDAAAQLARELEGSIEDAFAGSERVAIMLALAVNITELVRFESVVPSLHRQFGGSYMWEWKQGASAPSLSDAAFAVDFATKFVLAVQGRMPHFE
jgi:hypothetical protein